MQIKRSASKMFKFTYAEQKAKPEAKSVMLGIEKEAELEE